MGRFESLTSLALGRGPYEQEVIETSENGVRPQGQRYSSSGRPRNPETRRREREHVRAANEVMQVTGIVEDSIAARVKSKEALQLKNQETLAGLRFMEGGRAALVAGVWGVLGLRRRILLYQSYSQISILQIIRNEREKSSLGHLIFSGMPTVFAYHFSDWATFFLETVLEAILDEEDGLTKRQMQFRNTLLWLIDMGGAYVTLHFRLFATLQQLNLIPSTKILPGAGSLIPFSPASPLARPPPLELTSASLLSCSASILTTLAPFLVIIVHGRLKYLISRIVYRPIYKSLPRPTGDSMFSGLAITPPANEFDAPDQDSRNEERNQDESTLRALEGLPPVERVETTTRPAEAGRDGSDDEETELQATIISFDVEAADNVEPSLGTWSAELRNTNEQKVVEDVNYRVTGITMLPTIMATEGLREIVAGLVVMPLEAVMVRLVGRAYRKAAGLAVGDMWEILPSPQSLCFSNLLPAFGLQIIFTGVVWAGFTTGIHLWSIQQRALAEERAKVRAEQRRNS